MSESASHPSALTSDQVRKVAALARLAPTDSQVERYRHDLAAVLAYVERLRELAVSDVEPLANPVEESNRLRADEPMPGLPQASLLAIAPAATPPFVSVPKILSDGDGA